MAFIACLWRLQLIQFSFILYRDLVPRAHCSDHRYIKNIEIILSILILEHIFIHSSFFILLLGFLFLVSTLKFLFLCQHLFCVAVGQVKSSLLLVNYPTRSSNPYLP